MTKNPHSNAGDVGGSFFNEVATIPHTTGQLSLCTTTRESPCASTKTQQGHKKKKRVKLPEENTGKRSVT